jgi:hypothetical protein
VVAPPVAGAPGPLRHLGPSAVGVAVPGGDHFGLLVPAQRGIEREAESVKRDTEITQQQIGLRLIQNQEGLIRLARDLVARDIDTDEFMPARPLPSCANGPR